jgi:hypothetical protein
VELFPIADRGSRYEITLPTYGAVPHRILRNPIFRTFRARSHNTLPQTASACDSLFVLVTIDSIHFSLQPYARATGISREPRPADRINTLCFVYACFPETESHARKHRVV